MDGTHHAVGQSRAEFIDVLQPSRLFDLAVEGLQIILREPIQRDVADVRDDVQVDTVLVSRLRGRADGRLAVGLVPQIDPVTEQHVRLCLFRKPPDQMCDFFFQLLELFAAFRLGFRCDVLCDRVTVLFIIADDTTFPASILSQEYASFALLFLLFRHYSNSPPMKSSMNPPTISAAFFCISPVTWV